jgi:hypothetical protein
VLPVDGSFFLDRSWGAVSVATSGDAVPREAAPTDTVTGCAGAVRSAPTCTVAARAGEGAGEGTTIREEISCGKNAANANLRPCKTQNAGEQKRILMCRGGFLSCRRVLSSVCVRRLLIPASMLCRVISGVA